MSNPKTAIPIETSFQYLFKSCYIFNLIILFHNVVAPILKVCLPCLFKVILDSDVLPIFIFNPMKTST